jgi:hypothetical protein
LIEKSLIILNIKNIIKTYAIKWDEKILVNSENKDSLVWYKFIQEEMTDEEILENKKISLLKEIWELKQIKDWMGLVWEDTTEIDKKIQELKKEYNNL